MDKGSCPGEPAREIGFVSQDGPSPVSCSPPGGGNWLCFAYSATFIAPASGLPPPACSQEIGFVSHTCSHPLHTSNITLRTSIQLALFRTITPVRSDAVRRFFPGCPYRHAANGPVRLNWLCFARRVSHHVASRLKPSLPIGFPGYWRLALFERSGNRTWAAGRLRFHVSSKHP